MIPQRDPSSEFIDFLPREIDRLQSGLPGLQQEVANLNGSPSILLAARVIRQLLRGSAVGDGVAQHREDDAEVEAAKQREEEANEEGHNSRADLGVASGLLDLEDGLPDEAPSRTCTSAAAEVARSAGLWAAPPDTKPLAADPRSSASPSSSELSKSTRRGIARGLCGWSREGYR
eukprot:CAMPEP_0203996266 /NCGR_PEP_ID=MMETSP0360-20130528/12621_1 /ASSEMBLY_ACC=CAM_ASM_000342 /TAXON_ID=268821 /ORGANISM="Scrippsiella Hangoei, Strain SHTV-5" /LENGTH=174 /DNA_ID=CAMNT_0050937057 /DNA_START=37 /DNA_END=558 /DNA_ORIENTATION=-